MKVNTREAEEKASSKIQSGSKCTVEVTTCQLINVVASKDKEKTRLFVSQPTEK